MPRTRKKTEADRPTYRPSPQPVNEQEQFLAALAGANLRHIVDRYGRANVDAVLDAIAADARRQLNDRQRLEIQDLWHAQARPLIPVSVPRLDSPPSSAAQRRAERYRRHREEDVDSVIREQVRVRQLEDGLSIILEREPDSWERRRLVEFVDGVRAGKAVAQIALEAKVSATTVERGLREVRNARIAAEAEQLANPSPHNELNDGRGTNIPVLIEGENNRRASP
jgi:hypothetical protein